MTENAKTGKAVAEAVIVQFLSARTSAMKVDKLLEIMIGGKLLVPEGTKGKSVTLLENLYRKETALDARITSFETNLGARITSLSRIEDRLGLPDEQEQEAGP